MPAKMLLLGDWTDAQAARPLRPLKTTELVHELAHDIVRASNWATRILREAL